MVFQINFFLLIRYNLKKVKSLEFEITNDGISSKKIIDIYQQVLPRVPQNGKMTNAPTIEK